jgi:hypothetical protein
MGRSAGARSSPAPPVAMEMPDPEEVANVALLTGTIVEDPLRDKSRGGVPVTVLLVSFDAPDETVRGVEALCEVEVPDEIADGQREQLCLGERLVVLGRLTGDGGLWASAVVTRP